MPAIAGAVACKSNQKDIFMKTIAISLLALAAIATASLASQRNYELRQSPTYFGKYSDQCFGADTCGDYAPAINALTAIKGDRALSNFERLNLISEENDHGRH
jgi:hypothetical protein